MKSVIIFVCCVAACSGYAVGGSGMRGGFGGSRGGEMANQNSNAIGGDGSTVIASGDASTSNSEEMGPPVGGLNGGGDHVVDEPAVLSGGLAQPIPVGPGGNIGGRPGGIGGPGYGSPISNGFGGAGFGRPGIGSSPLLGGFNGLGGGSSILSMDGQNGITMLGANGNVLQLGGAGGGITSIGPGGMMSLGGGGFRPFGGF